MSKVAVGRARSMRQSHDSTDQLYNLTARFGASTPNSNRTRCIRGCTERRQGISPDSRIRHETEPARFCVGRDV
jgi:hypothetical protein